MGGASYCDSLMVLTSVFVKGKIGVVTVTYNSASMLDEFFSSLDAQTYHQFCLISVDNASTDNTVPLLKAYSGAEQVVIENTTNIGVAAGNNQGIRAAIDAECEYVLLINNDVVLDPGLFAELVQGLADHHCDMAVPLIYFMDPPDKVWTAGGSFQPKLGFRVRHRGMNEDDRGQFNTPTKIDYAPTCCVLIRREVFSKIGLMDERYFVYADDVDFMYRARRAGVTMYYVPRGKLWHKVNGLTGGSVSDFSFYYNARGRALFLHKHFRGKHPLFWICLHSLQDLIRAILHKSFRHPRKIKLRGMRDGRKVALEQLPQ
jgi:GT2 family glycosyltransferase